MRILDWIHYPFLNFVISYLIFGNSLIDSSLIFLITFIGSYHIYSINDYFDKKTTKLLLLYLALIISLILSFLLPYPSPIILSFLFICNYFYSKTLKRYPFIDVILIFLIAFLGVLFSTLQFSPDSVLFSSIFGFLAAVAHPLQCIRDYRKDSKNKYNTVAVFLGNKTKLFSALLLFVFSLCYYFIAAPSLKLNPFIILVYLPVFFYYRSDDSVLIWTYLKIFSGLFFMGLLYSYV